MTKCVCNPGEINLSCPIHGGRGQAIVGAMINSGGDIDPSVEERMNAEIKDMVASINRINDIKNRFTMVLPFEDSGLNKTVYSVWFKVDNAHRWPVTPVPVMDKDEAEMIREKLAGDIAKVLDQIK